MWSVSLLSPAVEWLNAAQPVAQQIADVAIAAGWIVVITVALVVHTTAP